MRLSRFHLATVKEVPADAEIVSHQLMLRAGMVRKLAAGIYTWSPLGLRVLRRVEQIVREEMNRAGAIEVLMPSIQPRELWEETGRWEKFGGQLLKIKDRKDSEFCYGPTHEEVITDFARQELKSYKQLPLNFYQIQTKFRDEIRPRFGVMRAREFLMKDAYSFHLTQESLAAEYQNMYDTYSRIFTRLGLQFRAVRADSGAIGGDASQEFHVLAESGEDQLAYSTDGDYAANLEAAEAVALRAPAALSETTCREIDTPTQKTIDEVSSYLGIEPSQCVKTILVRGANSIWALCVRGDHEINPQKAAKYVGMRGAEFELAIECEVLQEAGCSPGFVGPINLPTTPILVDRSARELVNFVCGANKDGKHFIGATWDDVPIASVVDLRTVREGESVPSSQGVYKFARGIEVGHVFQLGQKYAEAMGATVIDQGGKAQVMYMGCYGVGVSRIVAAAIEQNHDTAGIIWPDAMAPWQVAVCMINPKNDAAVTAAAEKLYDEFVAQGIDAVLDDRGLRPGVMFADIELIGIPHRVVVSERGLAAGTFEYRARRATDNEALTREQVFERFARR